MAERKRWNRPHLYIMRGIPGSGKSRIARKLLKKYRPGGIILSTDDFFRDENGKMQFKKKLLQPAHKWNRSRAFQVMMNQRNPVIIDNTNIRCCEMKSYVKMGLQFGYHIRFREAWDTWDCSIEELWRRINYVVPLPVMKKMKRSFEYIRDIYDVLNS